MDFASIGNLNNYIKTVNMKSSWEQKVKDPIKFAIPGTSSNIFNAPESSSLSMNGGSSFGDDRLTGIMTKVESGQDLSTADLEYLREKYPSIYEEVMKSEKEKKEYEKALRRCKTRDEARMLQLGKVSEAMSALKSGMDPKTVLGKLVKMTNAYVKFTGTKHYEKLAENQTELEEAIKAEKEAAAGNQETKPVEKEQTQETKEQAADGEARKAEMRQEHPDQKSPKPEPPKAGQTSTPYNAPPAPGTITKAEAHAAYKEAAATSTPGTFAVPGDVPADFEAAPASRGKINRRA